MYSQAPNNGAATAAKNTAAAELDRFRRSVEK